MKKRKKEKKVRKSLERFLSCPHGFELYWIFLSKDRTLNKFLEGCPPGCERPWIEGKLKAL